MSPNFSTTSFPTTPKQHSELAPQLRHWFITVIYSAYVLTFFIGFVGNILVCLVIKRRRKKRSIHLLTLNLAISDLIVLLVYLPMEAYQISTQWEWKLGHVACQIFYPVNSCTVNSSIYTLVIITRDRYIAVTKPMVSRQRNASSTRRWIGGIWFFSFILTLPLLFVVDAKFYCTEYWPNKTLDKAYWVSIFILNFVIPIVFIVCVYSVIIYNLRSSNLPRASNLPRHSNSNTLLRQSRAQRIDVIRRKKQQNKMMRMTIVLVLAYFLCVLPQHTVYFVGILSDLSTHDNIAYIFVIANYCLIVNSSINPVIYGTLNDEMKKGVQKLLLCKKKRKNVNQLILSFGQGVQRVRLRTKSVGSSSSSCDRSRTGEESLIPEDRNETTPM